MSRAGGIIVLEPGAAYSGLRWEIPALTTLIAWQALRATDRQVGGAAVKAFRAGSPATLRALFAGAAVAGSPMPFDGEPFGMPEDTWFGYGRNIQTCHRPLFETMVEALAPHVARVGLSSGPVEIEVFVGSYSRTPGGVHREACSNLHFVLLGTKTMYLWIGDDWIPPGAERRADVAAGTGTEEEYLSALDPAAVLAAGTSLSGSAGCGFAWAAGTWHVAETDGPAFALNVAAYQRSLEPESALPVWGEHLDGAVPPEFLYRYRHHVGLQDRPLAEALGRLSSLGMTPAPAERPERPASLVRLRLGVPVVWSRTRDGDLWIAALGAIRRLPPATPLDWLADRRAAADAEIPIPAAAEQLAGWLCQQGVLDVVEER